MTLGTRENMRAREGGGEEVGKSTVKMECWDASHYNMNQRPGTDHRAEMLLHWRSEMLRRKMRMEQKEGHKKEKEMNETRRR